MERRTGKTFRQLLRAIADASEGQQVFYVSNSLLRSREFYFISALKIIKAYIGADHKVEARHMDKKITFTQSGGTLRFTIIKELERATIGRGKVKEYYDD